MDLFLPVRRWIPASLQPLRNTGWALGCRTRSNKATGNQQQERVKRNQLQAAVVSLRLKTPQEGRGGLHRGQRPNWHPRSSSTFSPGVLALAARCSQGRRVALGSHGLRCPCMVASRRLQRGWLRVLLTPLAPAPGWPTPTPLRQRLRAL